MEVDWHSIIEPSSCPVTETEIATFESDVGFPLPDDYREFLLKYNGGKVKGWRDFSVPGCDELCVEWFHSLSEDSPGIGLVECRQIHDINKVGIRQSAVVGSNGLGDFYFLVLGGGERGAVYFGCSDELGEQDYDNWYSNRVIIPDCMIKVTSSFTELGKILEKTPPEYD